MTVLWQLAPSGEWHSQTETPGVGSHHPQSHSRTLFLSPCGHEGVTGQRGDDTDEYAYRIPHPILNLSTPR